jgi:hypothetical protein
MGICVEKLHYMYNWKCFLVSTNVINSASSIYRWGYHFRVLTVCVLTFLSKLEKFLLLRQIIWPWGHGPYFQRIAESIPEPHHFSGAGDSTYVDFKKITRGLNSYSYFQFIFKRMLIKRKLLPKVYSNYVYFFQLQGSKSEPCDFGFIRSHIKRKWC